MIQILLFLSSRNFIKNLNIFFNAYFFRPQIHKYINKVIIDISSSGSQKRIRIKNEEKEQT